MCHKRAKLVILCQYKFLLPIVRNVFVSPQDSGRSPDLDHKLRKHGFAMGTEVGDGAYHRTRSSNSVSPDSRHIEGSVAGQFYSTVSAVRGHRSPSAINNSDKVRYTSDDG